MERIILEKGTAVLSPGGVYTTSIDKYQEQIDKLNKRLKHIDRVQRREGWMKRSWK